LTAVAFACNEPLVEQRTNQAGTRMVVNCVAYEHGRKVSDIPIEDISEVLKEEGKFVWIGLHDPNEELLREIQEEFGLHDLAIEDAHRAHQRPKVEEYGDELFVVLRTAKLEGDEIRFGETHVFVGPHYVVSIRHGASLTYAHVRERCEATPQLLEKGPGFVLYALLDFIVDNYFPIVDGLQEKLEALEDEIFGGQFRRETTEHIYRFKRDLAAIKRAVSPLMEVCNRLTRFDHDLIPDDIQPYFRDVYDHVLRINESVDSLRDLLATVLEANLSLIAIGQNDVMKKLAGWAAILAVPTMIAGVYGMNFDFMPELRWQLGYPLAVATMASICGFLYYRFKQAGWL
jgi:magnesium transporter